MYTHQKQVVTQGPALEKSQKALILLHGRGATAESILALAYSLEATDFSLFAPQATNHSWYPNSFLAPVAQNQPALDSALVVLEDIVTGILNQGIGSQHIYMAGFSQGACLTAEYAARNARQYGGLFIFTGGLIGQQLELRNYQGDFKGTPVLMTTGNQDSHVPVLRVEESASILQEMGAVVTKKIYSGRPHTILEEEFTLARTLLGKTSAQPK